MTALHATLISSGTLSAVYPDGQAPAYREDECNGKYWKKRSV
jgi:hypothetical protein